MIIKLFLGYIFGYVRVSIEGYYIERFINLCKNNKIVIWNIKKEKNIKVYFNVSIKEFKKSLKIAKKLKCKVKIEKKKGIPFLINRYRKRKFLFFLAIIVFLIIIILSKFVWNIEIKEENGEEFNGIINDIKESGLSIGMLKKRINTKEIINKVSLKRDDIAWMGIEIKGTNIIVSLAKTEKKPNIMNDSQYCNIVSDKEGIITKINSQNGMANVKVGDIVKKGDILINGCMEGKYTGIRYLHARGDIEGKVWHTKSIKIPYKNEEKKKTGKEQKFYSIKFNNFEINLQKRVSKFEIYDRIETENRIKLFSNFYLPIYFIKTVLKEEIKETIEISHEEAKNEGIAKLEEQFEKEIEDKSKIVNRNINIYENVDEIEIYLTYEILEKIGTEEAIVF